MMMNETLKGAIFGAIGGLAGTYAMSLYSRAVTAMVGHDPLLKEREGDSAAGDDIAVAGMQAEEGESSTEALGRIAQETVTGQEPSEEQKHRLSLGIHWGYGTAVSALYGAVRGRQAVPDLTGGLLFGTAAWAIGDELMVPLLGLSKGPTAYPAEQHTQRLGIHLAYGVVAAATTQVLFATLAPRSRATRAAIQAAKAWAAWKVLKTVGSTAARTAKATQGMKSGARVARAEARRLTADARRAAAGGKRTATRAMSRSGKMAGGLRKAARKQTGRMFG